MTATEVLSLGLDIGIKNGKIKCIGEGLEASLETNVVDAEGAYITPGYVGCGWTPALGFHKADISQEVSTRTYTSSKTIRPQATPGRRAVAAL